MVYRKWKLAQLNEQIAEKLNKELELPIFVCKMLACRGIDTVEKAVQFLGDETQIPSPNTIKDMDKLVQRVNKAIEQGEKIVVYGDYDVDGVTATAVMLTYLESVGAQAFYKLPTRTQDGYGLNKNTIKALAEKGVTLIITVDNGISANSEIEYAKTVGIDVVVTDHHLPSDNLPDAVAVVDPLRKDDTSAFKNLSGAGVAFMAICAIEGCEAEEMLEYYADLVAIGTIADIMSLTGANRQIVKKGVQLLQNPERAGLIALLEKSGLADKTVTRENVSFGLSPRLNAAGRMNDAALSLNLLLEEEYDVACEMASQIEQYNQERQQTEQRIVSELITQVETDKELQKQPVLVVWGENYHQGVIGIVASRLLEKYSKPTIVFSVDENNMAKGSGRSLAGFSLYNAIASCKDLLERFGGHDLAAGMSVKYENLQQFSKQINAYALQNKNFDNHATLNLDMSVKISELTIENIEALDMLAPFGHGNISPMFLLNNVTIEAAYPLTDGKHTRIKLSDGKCNIYAVIFSTNINNLPYKQGDKVDVAISVSIFTGQNGKMISGRIKEIRPANINQDFIKYCSLYNKFQNSLLIEKTDDFNHEFKQLCPVREDVVQVYKYICNNKLFKSDLRPVFSKLIDVNSGKILACIDILKELEHIKEHNVNGSTFYTKSEEKIVKPLTQSRLLAILEKY